VNSGDVDILICPPDGVEAICILPKLIDDLGAAGFLTDHLSLPSAGDDENERGSYMGVCKLPEEGSLHRRIDIKVRPVSKEFIRTINAGSWFSAYHA
jgi:hypothetical protein